MEKNHRREFLKKSILGLSASAFHPLAGIPFLTGPVQKDTPDLPSRMLGRTGIKVPVISMGTSSASSPGLVLAAWHSGIRLFFSATYYGEGSNERMVGEGLKGLPRNSYMVGTAIPLEGYDTRKGVLESPLSVKAYIKKVDESLARFGLKHVDFLLFPYAGKRAMILNKSLMNAMQKVKRQGKARYLGIATHGFCDEALIAAADAGIYDVAMTAYNYKTGDIEAVNKAIDYAIKAGMGIVAMKTTAGAFNDKAATKPVNTNAALKWVLQNENISSIVSGMSSLDELDKNRTMINDLKLTEQELKDLSMADLYAPSLYCRQCRQCVPQCPHNLEIPVIMRSYMYAYGYRNFRQARHALTEADLPAGPCSNCESCHVKCRAGFNIKDRIEDICRIRDVPDEFLI